MRNQTRSHMRPVIEKELLHYDILFALDQEGLLDSLTFQGGTSLRLCYGAPRFSEDLDFVGGYDFESRHLMSIKTCLEDYLIKRYALEISIKEPKDFSQVPENKNIQVSKWQLRLVTHPEQRDLPKQIIKIEIANVPAYTKTPKQLLYNYDFLPDGYNDTIVMVETLDEILADKIVAFVNCQAYVRHRDIWDFYWLKQQGAIVNMDLINRKIHDYKINDYTKNLEKTIENLNNIINGPEFKAQMSRFLPTDIQERTLLNQKYLHLLSQDIFEMLDSLGFEWREEKNGEIYCANSLHRLTQTNFEKTIIMMKTLKDKHGLIIAYNKTPKALIVSIADEPMAKELCMLPIYQPSLSQGYRVDPLLQSGRWFIKFD